MAKPLTWCKIHKEDFPKTENFLRSWENICVGACARFISLGFSHAWSYYDENNEITAVLLHSRGSLYPVFSGKNIIPMPRFFNRFLEKGSVYSIQGLKQDVEFLEKGMKENGQYAADIIDYDLMTLNTHNIPCFQSKLQDLVLRPPVTSDKEELFCLHSSYEKEEVIPKHGFFNPAGSRKTLDRLLCEEKMLIAVVNNRIVGKINTNAKSFSKYQIGGVYVLPDFRGMGIAKCMSRAFLQELMMSVKGVNLFVKKRNIAANKLYRSLGFNVLGDYRISYY